MSLVKYRLREVAADFGVAPKEIAEIISKFYEKPKSNTQVLSDDELNVVFDYMTQKNQIKSLIGDNILSCPFFLLEIAHITWLNYPHPHLQSQ